ncbi:MAG TPA: LysR substrate-binding domain-containing protein [Candidatus Acidoferrum sp.]|nr:LysR substrate-binding domain-containing protein [Candidatus Acidoferrum sp.]
MKFTLRQLEVFLATARSQHLSRAAAGLAMSQSAASDALRELESQFDLPLFDRIGKRLQLNDHGRLLLPQAEELLSRAQALEDSLRGQPGTGTLKVGATLSIGNQLCIPLIDRYRRVFPGSRISLEIGNTATISTRVANFDLDVGLIEGDINDPALDIVPWRDDDLTLFASPRHPLATRKSLGRADLLAAEWILRENGSGTRQTFNRVMHDLLPHLNVVLEMQQNEAIIQAVKAGMGLGCLSLLSLQDHIARGELVPLAARNLKFRRKFYFITHRHKFKTSAMQHWLALCLATAET